ncbi:hypothetical protein ACFQNF_06830 [Iodobacter arcticus]|uniref:FagA protein n=1 Tax=Iodobacter arcticus TaxID=590593 RepID=A0ABW2QV43_9NEIS
MQGTQLDLPPLDLWQWLACKISWALEPDEPALIQHYFAAGRALQQHGLICPACCAQRSILLLHRSACDLSLPWYWRMQCMDAIVWPLADFERLAQQDDRLRCALLDIRLRLAHTELIPPLQ